MLIAACQRRPPAPPRPPTTSTASPHTAEPRQPAHPRRAYRRLICPRTHGSPSFKLRPLILALSWRGGGTLPSSLRTHMGAAAARVAPVGTPRSLAPPPPSTWASTAAVHYLEGAQEGRREAGGHSSRPVVKMRAEYESWGGHQRESRAGRLSSPSPSSPAFSFPPAPPKKCYTVNYIWSSLLPYANEEHGVGGRRRGRQQKARREPRTAAGVSGVGASRGGRGATSSSAHSTYKT